MDKQGKNINRRDFLKIVGIASAATALQSCAPDKGKDNASAQALAPVPVGKMTYRNFSADPKESVSILGYGCMRWPTIPNPDGEGDLIDQDEVNRLVDYAIEHGVNYFDSSTV